MFRFIIRLIITFVVGKPLMAFSGDAQQIYIEDQSGIHAFGFSFVDGYGETRTTRDFPSEKNGNFPIYKIQSREPIVILFSRGDFGGSPVLLEPGDSCIVRNQGRAFFFQGNKPHDQLNFMLTIEKKTGLFKPNFPPFNANLKVMMALEDYMQRMDSARILLDEVLSSASVSQASKNIVVELMRYKVLGGLLFPFYRRPDGYDFNSLPKDYFELLQSRLQSPFNDSLLFLNYYKVFLWNYCKYLTFNNLRTSAEFSSMFENARTKFTGSSRDYIMFYVLKHYLKAGERNEAIVEVFFRECKTEMYKTYIRNEILEKLQGKALSDLGSTKLTDQSGNLVTWSSIMNASRGKMVYVDCWASWCTPCIAEFPHLQKAAAGVSKDSVEFIMISIDIDFNKWTAALKKYELQSTTSKHFLLDPQSPLAKRLGLPPIPRYMLFDREGNVSFWEAPRPSSPSSPGFFKDIVRQ